MVEVLEEEKMGKGLEHNGPADTRGASGGGGGGGKGGNVAQDSATTRAGGGGGNGSGTRGGTV